MSHLQKLTAATARQENKGLLGGHVIHSFYRFIRQAKGRALFLLGISLFFAFQAKTQSITCIGPAAQGVTICPQGAGSLTSSASCAAIRDSINKFPVSAAVSGTGALWNRPTSITAKDTSYASVTLISTTSTTSQTIAASNYGFAIPANATIKGIKVYISRYANNTGVTDNSLVLLNNGVAVGNNKASTAAWPSTAAINETEVVYGDTNDLWNTTWSVADINASQFGVAFSAKTSTNNRTAYLNSIRVTVFYTLPGQLYWYAASSGGDTLGSGPSFNPVGKTGSPLQNTNTPGVYKFYVACSGSTGCRTEVLFTINTNTAIQTQPVGGAICPGGNVSMNVSATGTGLAYQWKNGSTNVGTNSSSYVASAAGNYTVMVSGSCGTVTSDAAAVSLKTATKITAATLTSAQICPGDSISLSATAVGENITYQWQRNSSNISGATNSAYAAKLAGTYRLIVSGDCGKDTSVSATINLRTATSITTEPTGAAICPGATHTMQVVSAGEGLTYLWYKDGAAIATATAANITTSEPGNYQVIVTGTCGTDTSVTATISYRAVTSITTEPLAGDICPGSTHTMSVVADGAGLTYQWFRNGSLIPTATQSAYTTGVGGTYTVVVNGQCGMDTSAFVYLRIKAATSITTQPASSSAICPNDSVTLSVAATGEGALSYQWRLNGVAISGANGVAYTAKTAGTYSVVVSGECGNDTSVAASVRLKSVTSITSHPSDTAFCPNGTVTLHVSAQGEGLVYQWRIDGNAIPNATASTYAAGTVGSYTVFVSGDCGTAESHPAVVRMRTATAITAQPQGGEVCPGNSIIMAVSAVGEGLTYQWKNGNNTLLNATSASYSANAMGSYTVAVTGTCGVEVSSAAVLRVKTVTSIGTHPQSGAICPGSNTTLTVSAAGEGLRYQWFKNGDALANDTLSTLNVSDSGSYQVRVTGDCGTVTSDAAAVRIKTVTGITTHPQSANICPSTTATLSVSAVGEGLHYQWYKDASAVSGAQSSSYTTGVAGTYTVSVEGDCANQVSDGAVISIKAPTVITSQPQGGSICSGQNIALTVTATGEGTLTYQWKKGGVNITNAVASSYDATEEGSYTVVITGACGAQTSAAAVVAYHTATSVKTQPVAKIIAYGDNTSFATEGIGYGAIRYQWQVKPLGGNWSAIEAGGVYASPTAATLQLTATPIQFNGNTYRAVISATCGDVFTNEVLLTVNKATLTVRAQNKTKIYGDALPVLTDTIFGFKNNESLSTPGAVSGSSSMSTTATALSNVGTYAITTGNGTLASENYDFNFVNGTLTITQATITVTADNVRKTYASVNPALTYQMVGYVDGQTYGSSSGVTGTPTVSTTASSSSYAGNYPITIAKGTLTSANYAFAFVNGTLAIDKAVVTVTANNKTRYYGVADSAYTATYSGFLLSDGYGTAGGVSGTPSFSAANSPKADAGTYNITPSQGSLASPNYSFAYTNGTLNVLKATLNIKANNKTRIYGAADTTYAVTYSGFANGETAETSGLTGTPSFSTGATLKSAPGSYTITPALGTLNANNYFFTYSTGTLTINRALLSVNADSTTKLYGAAVPALNISYVGFMNGETIASGSDVTGSATLTTTAKASSVVGVYPITFSTASLTSTNYLISYKTSNLSVTKAPLTVAADTLSKAYGASLPTLTYKIAGYVNNDNASNSGVTGTPVLGTTALVSSPVGNYTITPTQGTLAASNYYFVMQDGVLRITKVSLTVTADAKSRTYGAPDPAFTVRFTGFVNGDSLSTSDVQGIPGFSTNAKDTSRVGSYTITPSIGTLSSNNYLFGPFNTGALSITKANLTVKADSVTKTYGAANPALTFTFNGFVNNESYGTGNAVTGAPALTTTATNSSPAGVYPVTIATGTLSSVNYNFIFSNGGLRVNKATLNVTALNASRNYGASNPAFSVRFTGYVNGDTTSTAVSGAPLITTTATVNSAVGTYPVTPAAGTLTANNYSFHFVNGTLTVNKAVLTVKATNTSRLYGQANPSFTASYNGFLNGDSTNVLSGEPAFTTIANEKSIPANYAIVPATGTLTATNYSFAFQNGTLSVGKAVLTATADNKTKKYGDANPSLTITYNGLVNGDSINGTVMTGTPSVATSVTPLTPVGTYAITLAAGTQVSSYYTITYQSGVMDVQKAILSVKANNTSKTYGEANPALQYTLEGFKNNEQAGAGVLTGAPELNTTATIGSDAGTYPIRIDSGTLTAANYTFALINGTLTINKQKLTVSVNNQTRKYGQRNDEFTANYSGFITGQDKLNSDVTGVPQLSTIASALTGVGNYTINIALGTLSSNNYSFELVAGTLSITRAPLNLMAEAKTRAYGAANPAFTVAYEGFVNGEDFESSGLVGEPQMSTTANTVSPVGTYPITFVPGVTSSSNYELTYQSGLLTVARALLTLTADNVTKAYGQPNPAFTYSITGFMNADDASVLSGSPALSTNAGTLSDAGSYAIQIDSGSLQASNYTFRFEPGLLSISKATITVTVNNETRKYGAGNPVFSVVYAGFITGQDKSSSDIQGLPNLFTIADAKAPVGHYAIQIEMGTLSSNNYAFNLVPGNLSVTPASLRIIADNKHKTYGASNPEFTFTYNGFVNGEVVATSDLSGTPEAVTTATASSNVGSYPISFTPGLVTSANYTIEYVNATMTIGKALLTVAADGKTKVYGQPNPLLTYQFTGFVNGDELTTPGVLSGTPSITTTATSSSGVAAYPITVGMGTLVASNYSFSFVSATLSVTKATLQVVALDTSRSYGGQNPAFKVRYDGFISGQTLATSDVSGSPTITTTATAVSPVGKYDIEPSQSATLYSNNYTFNFVKGTLTVGKVNLIVAAQPKTRIYGAPDTGLVVTYTGFVNGENSSVLSGAPVFATNATASSAPGAYTITPNVGSLQANNYAFVGFSTATLTITKAPLIVSADNKSRFYGGVTPALTATYSGLMNGETYATSGITGTPTLSQTTTNKSNAGTYPISITAGNLASTNYSFTSFVNGVLTIDKAPLNVTADNKSKNYGTLNPALTYTITGLVNGENLNNSGVSGAPVVSTNATTTSAAGNYDIVPSQGTLAAGNYSFVMVKGTLTINKVALTVTALAKTRMYGAPDTGFVATYSGFVNGDNASVISGTPSFTTNATAKSSPGAYTITPGLGTLTANNYTFGTFSNGTLTITKAPLTVKADNKNKSYGTANPALTISYIGLMNGETFATSGITGSASVTTTATNSSVVNSYPITFQTQNYSSTNYSFTYSSGTLTVDKAILNVTANNAARAYGVANPAFTYTITGFVLNETSSVVSGAPQLITDATSTSPAGTTYDIIPSNGTLAAANYTFNFVKGLLTVGKVTLTVKAESKSRAYGAADPAFSVTYSGFVNGETRETSDLQGQPAYFTNATVSSGVGSYAITPIVGTLTSSNYSFVFVNAPLIITTAPVNVIAADKRKTYGAANPSLTFSYEGLVNGETFATSGITGSPLITTSASLSSPVGTYPITIGQGSLTAANYSFSFSNGNLSVDKATIQVTAANASKTYGAANPVLTYTFNGFQNGENYSSGGITGEPVLRTVTDAMTGVGNYEISIEPGTLASSNYAFAFTSGQLTINKAKLSVVVENKTRVYGSRNPALTVSYNGFVNGQTFEFSGVTGDPQLSTLADQSSDVGEYPITAQTGTLTATNYDFDIVPGTLTITKAMLNVKVVDTSKIYGAANPAFTVTYAGFVNGQDLSTSGVSGQPVFTTTADASSNTGQYDVFVSAGNLTAKNYAFTYVKGNLIIGKATLTVKANDLSKVYGSPNPLLTVTYSGFVNGQNEASSGITGMPVVSTTATDGSNVGTYPIFITTGSLASGNYAFTESNGVLTIGKATLTIKAEAKSRTYGSPNPALTFTYNGFVNGQTIASSGVTGSAALGTNAIPTSEVGNYAITAEQGTLASANYAFQFVPSTLTITKAMLNVKVVDTSKIYGAANPAFTVTYAGFVNGQDLSTSGVSGQPVFTTTADASSNTGQYDVFVSAGNLTAKNYAFTYMKGNLTIGKATLTVKANDLSREYGSNNPTLTYTMTGFVNGENQSTGGIAGAAVLSTTAIPTSNVGDYEINIAAGSLASGNYDFLLAKGTLHVGKALLTVKANHVSRKYGESNPGFTASYNGFVNGQNSSTIGMTGSPVMTTIANELSSVGTYPITTAIGTLTAPNYDFTAQPGTLEVTKAIITVKADDKRREYGVANPAFTASYNGFTNGETFSTSGISGAPALTTSANEASAAGSYVISAAIGTLTADNYDFTFSNGKLEVGKALIYVSADNKKREYGDPTPSLTYTISGFPNGETLSSSGITGAPALATDAVANSPVGTYDIVPGKGTLLSNNYEFSFLNGRLQVEKAVLTVRADSTSRVYGQANPPLTASFFGFKNGEDMASSGVTGLPALVAEASPLSNTGDYTINVSAGSLYAFNYSFRFETGTLTVRKAQVTVKANDASRAYGNPDPVFTASYNGFVNGETFSNSGISGTPAFTTDATPGSAVGTYTITPGMGSLNAGNYAFTYATGALNITKAVITVVAEDYIRYYGDPNPELSASYSGFVNGELFATSDITGAPSISTNADAFSGVGEYPITINEGTLKSGNYSFEFKNGTIFIDKTIINIVADDKTRKYGEFDPTFTITYDGLKNGEIFVSSGIVGRPAIRTTANIQSGVGVYDIIPSIGTMTSANYAFRFVNGKLSIDKADVVVVADNKERVYGAANPAWTVSYKGLKNNETPATAGITGVPQLSSAANALSGVGTYPILQTSGVLSAANYDFTYADGTLTIGKATITVKAENKTRIYGEDDPAFTVTYNGFANGEAKEGSGIAGQPAISTTATANSNAGEYPIIAETGTLIAANYKFAFERGTLLIDKAPVLVKADNSTKVYGQANPAFTASYTGFKNGQVLGTSDITGAPAYSTIANALSGVGYYDVTSEEGTLASNNYRFTFDKGQLEVTKASITVSADDKERGYGEVNPALTASYSGFVNGENWSTSGMSGEPVLSTSANAFSEVGVYPITVSPGTLLASNYNFAVAEGKLSVGKSIITVKADDKIRTYGDANPDWTFSYAGFKNGETLATSGITGDPSVITDANETSTTGDYPIKPVNGSLLSDKYAFQFEEGSLTIEKALLLLRLDNKTRVYGSSNPAWTISYEGFKNSEELATSGITGTPSITTMADASTPVGIYDVYIEEGTLASANYTFAFANGGLEITKARITVIADDKGRAYGEANPALTASYSGFVNGENWSTSGITGAPSLLTEADAYSGIGVYPITAGTGSLMSSNYSFAFAEGKLSVGKSVITVKAENTSRAYGEANPTWAVTYNGFKNGEVLGTSGITGTPSISTDAVANSTAGNYPIKVGIGSLASDKYTFQFEEATLVIDKAQLLLRVDNKTKVYGSTNPAWTISYEGFKNGEVLSTSDITGEPSLTTIAGNNSPVGNYPVTIEAGTLASLNYSFAFANGGLEITKARITVIADDKGRAYGEANPALTASYSGFVNGENWSTSGITGAPSLLTEADASSGIGVYPITAGTGSLMSSNYSFAFAEGKLSVGKSVITVKAENTSRAYGEANPTWAVTYNGFKNGEVLGTSGITGTPLISTDAVANSTAGNYPIKVSIGSLASDKYTFQFEEGTLTVTKVPVIVRVENKTKVYGSHNPEWTVVYEGLKNGETFATSGIAGAPRLTTSANAYSPVGTYDVFVAAGSLSSSNYTFGFENGQLSVTKALITITADDRFRGYGQENPAFTVSYAGFVNSEDLLSSGVTGQPALNTMATVLSPVGSYDITADKGSLQSANYSFLFVSGKLTVGKAVITVTAENKQKVYGDANPEWTVTYNGFMNGETLSTSTITGAPAFTVDANEHSAVGTYLIALSKGTLQSDRYSFALVNGTLQVDKAVLTVRAENKQKVYGDANPPLTASFDGFRNGETLLTSGVSGEPVLATSVHLQTGVGIYPINMYKGSLTSGNYRFDVQDGSLEVTKATITITADDKSRTYGSQEPLFTAAYNGFKNGEILAGSGITGMPSLTTTATINSPVGVYPINVSTGTLQSANYDFIFTKGSLSIDKAVITVTADNKRKIYGAQNPALTVTYNGFVNGETLGTSGISGMPTINTMADQFTVTGEYPISLSTGNLLSSNYQFNLVNGVMTIGKATVTLTIANSTRTYGMPNPAFTASYSGFVNGEDLSNSGITGTPSLSTVATATTPAGTYPITGVNGTLLSANYDFAFQAGELTIDKAILLVTANDITRPYGAVNPVFTATFTGFKNGETLATSDITGAPPAMSTSASVTSPVGTYVINISAGTLASTNYSFTYADGKLKVVKANLLIRVENKSRKYGEENPALTVAYEGFAPGEHISNSDVTGEISLFTTATSFSDAGVYDIVAALGSLSSNRYNFSFENGSLTVDKAVLRIKADDQTREFGMSNPALTSTISGFVNGETWSTSGITGAALLSTMATTASPVGVYPITVGIGSLTSGNYSFDLVNGSLAIGKAVLIVRADNKVRSYGSGNPALTVSYNGFINGQDLASSGISGAPEITTVATVSSRPGQYEIIVSQGTLNPANYTLSFEKGTLTVNKAVLTVSAEDKRKTYGSANPGLTASISGFVNGEELSSSDVTGSVALTTSVTTASPVGLYAIAAAAGTMHSNNYSFEFNTGTLTVDKAVLSVTAEDQRKAYGAANPVLTARYEGFVNGESLANSGVAGQYTIRTTATALSDAGTYPINIESGTLMAQNYAFQFVDGMLTVDKAVITLTADNKTRSYGVTNPALTASWSGFVNGQTLANSGITGQYTITTAASASSTAGTYAIELGKGDLISNNYEIRLVNGTLTVGKAVVTVLAENKMKTYGAENPTFTASIIGFSNGETLATSGISGTPVLTTTADQGSGVGVYPIAVSAGTLSAPNYDFNFVNGSLVIEKATLTVRADDKSRTYGQSNPSLTATFNGFVNGETLASSGIIGSAVLSTSAVSTSPAGTYPISIATGSLFATNYSFVLANGTITVDKALLNITADNKSKAYGAANPALTVSYNGFVNGETLQTSGLSGTLNLATNATALSPAGQYNIVLSQGTLKAANYIFQFNQGVLTVGKAVVKVIADSKTKTYGESNPAFTYAYSGFVNGETLATSGISGQPSVTTTATQSSPVDLYAISVAKGSLSSANYDFEYVNATLIVRKAQLTIRAEDMSRPYGAANPVFAAMYNGFVNGETLATSGLLGSISLTTIATVDSDAGIYDIVAAQGTLAAANYAFTFVNGKLSVGKSIITVVADSKVKVYGDAVPALTAQLSGFAPGETLATSGITGQYTITTSALASSGAGTYPIVVTSGTLASDNYVFNFVNGTLTVEKAILVVTADDKQRKYGEGNPAFSASINGFRNGEALATSDVTGEPGFYTAAVANTVPGKYPIVVNTGSIQSGNYTFQFVNGSLSIDRSVLTLTAENKSRNFGQENPLLTVTYNGFANGESIVNSDVTGMPAITTAATVGSDIGNYPIALAAGTLRSDNYTLQFVNGNLSVLDASCAPVGTLSVSDACYGTNIQLTYTSTSGTGPFTLVINDSVYKNIQSGVPFETGTMSMNAPESIWPGVTVPVFDQVGSNEAMEVGVKFRPTVPGEITGIRFYKVAGNTGTHTGSLWSSDGALLATATFTGETASGWQQVSFNQPVAVTPGATYIASYYAPNGQYAYAANAFTGKRITNKTGTLTALKASDGGNGIYRKGAGYPVEQTADNGNFYVDVVFKNTSSVSRFALTGVIAADGCAANAQPITAVQAKMGAFFDMTVSKQSLACLENNDGIITITATGCNAPFIFSINNGAYQSASTFSNLKAGSYSVRIKDATNLVRDTTIVVGVETAVWTGAENSDWHNPANWSTNKVPGVHTHVIIGASANECRIISADVTVKSIQIRQGATLRPDTDRKINMTGSCKVLPVQ